MRRAPVNRLALIAVGAGARAAAGGAGLQDFSSHRARPLSRSAQPIAAAVTRCRAAAVHSPAAGRSKRRSAFWSAPNITPDRETGIGAWTDDEFDAAVTQWPLPKRRRGFIRRCRFPITPDVARRTSRISAPISTRSSRRTTPSGSTGCRSRSMSAASMIGVGRALFQARRIPSGHIKISGMESRRLSGAGARALRRLPHAEDVLGGDKIVRGVAAATHCKDGPRPISPVGRARFGNWSLDDIATYLKTGHNRNAAAAGLMGEVVDLSTSKLSDDDLKAMAAYLKDISGPAANTVFARPAGLAAGAAIYQDLCSRVIPAGWQGGPKYVSRSCGNRDRQGE